MELLVETRDDIEKKIYYKRNIIFQTVMIT